MFLHFFCAVWILNDRPLLTTISTDLSVCLGVITRSQDVPLPIMSVSSIRMPHKSFAIDSVKIARARALIRLFHACNGKHIGLADHPGRSVLPRSLSLRNDLVFLIALSRNTSVRCCINEALLHLASLFSGVPRDIITDKIILPSFLYE